MEMPSDTEIVPNSSGKPPPARTPSLARLASRSSDRLHGVISFHDEATTICGLLKSSSVMPTARSIARAGARSYPRVTSRLRGWRSTDPSMNATLRPLRRRGVVPARELFARGLGWHRRPAELLGGGDEVGEGHFDLRVGTGL